MNAAMQNSLNQLFSKKYAGFIAICFYWLEFSKSFNLLLLLDVLTIVYMNLVEPSSESPDIPTVSPQRGRLVKWFSIFLMHSDFLKETHACGRIKRVFTCPKKPPYTILLSINSSREEDEEDQRKRRSCAKAIDAS